MADPILEVPRPTPGWWCVPSWHKVVVDFVANWGASKYVLDPGATCIMYDTCPPALPNCIRNAVNCAPEDLRLDAERKLQSLGLYQGQELEQDVYSLARNIHSELWNGTVEEKVAIAIAGMNRARGANSTVTANLVGRSGVYGEQNGSEPNRPASTRHNPTVADVLVAQLVYDGIRAGSLEDFTNGATHYFDRVGQDAQRSLMIKAGQPAIQTGEEVYLDWTAGGDFMTWVGHIPNTRPIRLMLFRRRYELARQPDVRAAIRKAGHQAIKGVNRVPAPWNACVGPAVAVVNPPIHGLRGARRARSLRDLYGLRDGAGDGSDEATDSADNTAETADVAMAVPDMSVAGTAFEWTPMAIAAVVGPALAAVSAGFYVGRRWYSGRRKL